MNPEYPIYEWINKDLCTKILNSYTKNSCKINNLDIQYATNKGDNFTSALFRIKVAYNTDSCSQERQLQFILKTPIEADVIESVSEEFNIFTRESNIYGSILEKCYELLKEKSDKTIFGPR